MRTLNRPRIVVPLALTVVIAGGGVAFASMSSASTADTTRTARHHRGGHAGALGRVIHGSGVVRTKDGSYATVDEQRGAVTAVSATSLTVKSADGFVAGYVLSGSTKVRDAGKSSAVSALKTGENVIVTATVHDSTATATHVVVPKTRTS